MGSVEWRLLHVLAVVLFLGNLTTSLFWAAHATRTRHSSVVAHTFEGIRRSDLWFTLPGALGIVAGGVAAAVRMELSILGTGWVVWAIGLLGMGLGVLVTVRAGLQRDLQELVGSGSGDDVPWKEYDLLYRYWRSWTLIAIAGPLGSVLLMTYRPPLPGF
jgi:uncharacterized membrane protein